MLLGCMKVYLLLLVFKLKIKSAAGSRVWGVLADGLYRSVMAAPLPHFLLCAN